jgi:hypothetical protein
MLSTPERRLRSWAISGTVLIVVMAALPIQVLMDASNIFAAPSLLNQIVKIVITGAVLFIVLGFYLRMLFECGFGREIDHRGAWLTLLIIAPLMSAYIYYWVTRSRYYAAQRHRPQL